MMATAKQFEHNGLIITVQDVNDTVTIRWFGVSDTREPAIHLSPYLVTLLDGLNGKTVVVDFREFEYMNSATVSPIINFVRNLDARGAKTTLLFDSNAPWQKVNAQCMRAIARTLTNVNVP